MRIELVMFGSLLLSTFVVGNAYYQKKQFYPSVVHITKSNPSMMVKKDYLCYNDNGFCILTLISCCLQVIYIQALVIVVLLGKLMKRIFFGQLRAAEVEVCVLYILKNTQTFTKFSFTALD
jgi:E3 ubiquitin-protein ligase synoviolin